MRNQRIFQTSFRMGGSFIQTETSLSLFCENSSGTLFFSSYSETLLPSNRADFPFLPGLGGSQGVGLAALAGDGESFLFAVLIHAALGFGPSGIRVSMASLPGKSSMCHSLMNGQTRCSGLRSINIWMSFLKAMV